MIDCCNKNNYYDNLNLKKNESYSAATWILSLKKIKKICQKTLQFNVSGLCPSSANKKYTRNYNHYVGQPLRC